MVGTMRTLQNLALTNGVLAAVLIHNGLGEVEVSPLSTKLSKDQWQQLFTHLAVVLDEATKMQEDEVRLVAGDYALTARKIDNLFLGVATPIGHPVVKSLRRTMARTMKALLKVVPATTRSSSEMTIR
jgi:hypothetical protein